METRSRWDILAEFFYWHVLLKLGLMRRSEFKRATKFYLDWLKDMELRQPISKEEKDAAFLFLDDN